MWHARWSIKWQTKTASKHNVWENITTGTQDCKNKQNLSESMIIIHALDSRWRSIDGKQDCKTNRTCRIVWEHHMEKLDCKQMYRTCGRVSSYTQARWWSINGTQDCKPNRARRKVFIHASAVEHQQTGAQKSERHLSASMRMLHFAGAATSHTSARS